MDQINNNFQICTLSILAIQVRIKTARKSLGPLPSLKNVSCTFFLELAYPQKMVKFCCLVRKKAKLILKMIGEPDLHSSCDYDVLYFKDKYNQ